MRVVLALAVLIFGSDGGEIAINYGRKGDWGARAIAARSAQFLGGERSCANGLVLGGSATDGSVLLFVADLLS